MTILSLRISSPWVGLWKPLITFTSVVLPAPLGPKQAQNVTLVEDKIDALKGAQPVEVDAHLRSLQRRHERP